MAEQKSDIRHLFLAPYELPASPLKPGPYPIPELRMEFKPQLPAFESYCLCRASEIIIFVFSY